MKRYPFCRTALIGMALCLIVLTPARAAEISIPPMTAKPGETVVIPVMLDRVDNLAGVKLVMKYEAHLLTFTKADKTSHTQSMMHIVNDKHPGTLIAVMAAARGIEGKAFPILTLVFQVNPDAGAPMETRFKIREAQLMSDELKDIPYTTHTAPLKILPSAGGPAEGEGGKNCPFE